MRLGRQLFLFLFLALLALDGARAAESTAQEALSEARALLDKGDAAAAALRFEALAGDNPDRPDLFALWAIALARSGDREGARKVATLGLEKHPESPLLMKTLNALGPPPSRPASSISPPVSEHKRPMAEPPPGFGISTGPGGKTEVPSAPLSAENSGRKGRVWKSVLIPGWGTWDSGQKRRGALIGLPALGFLGAAVWAGWAQRREVHAYDGASDASRALEHARAAEDLRTLAAAFSAAGGTLWLFGILDASLSRGRPGAQIGVRF